MNGVVSRLSRSAASASLLRLDRHEEVAPELGLAAQQAGVEELHDRPQVADVVLDRRAGQRDAPVAPAAHRAACDCLVSGFLMFCASSRTTPAPVHLLAASPDRGAAARSWRAPGRASPPASTKASPCVRRHAVMDQHRQVGREALRLLLPVADDRGRADQQASADGRRATRAASMASVCTVLPRPMSSARQAPSPQRRRKASQE